MKKRILSFILTVAILITILPPINVFAAKAGCTSDTCSGCNVTCTFNPKSTLTWGDELSFSGKITSDSTIQKVTVKAFDIDNPDKYAFQIYTNQSVGSKTFYLSNVPDFTAGESLSKNWDGVIIVIYVVLSNETKVHHEYEYEIEFEDLDTPTISSPDEDDTFYAGDDITFKWGSISGAEEFEWEFYEGIRSSGKLLDSDTTGTSSSSRKAVIDGDSIKAGKSYSFYVRATNDYSDSKWRQFSFDARSKPSELYADPEELSFTKDGGKDYIDLTSSHEWAATVSVGWIKLSDDSGTGDEEIAVTVSANTGSSRIGVITIKSEVGSITVNVLQAKGETSRLDVSTTQIQTSYEEGYESFSVTSNLYDWKVSSNVDWLSVTNSSLDLNASVKISVDENKSTEPRTGIITVIGGDITKTVTVTQDGRPAIVGDINNDGVITNKDRFLLNRYLANMTGYTNINQTTADINGDGIIDRADADYLTYHLAGIKGYETFPEHNAPCLHTNCDAIYAGKTVFVNNTIKNDGVHSYYHMWHYVCKDCGENLGEFQGDDAAIKGASEKNVPCTYNSDGVCSCGAIDTTGYSSWTAINIADKQIPVYDTPYSTDGSYGKIFVNESVKVLGSKAGRYLIEYTVTSTNAKKQGYVSASFLASNSNYRLEFEFETITLPVSGRTVLLIPKNGSAFYHLYDGTTTIWQTNLLDNLTINFEHSASVQDDGYTTLTGKLGGFGTMNAYYIENGKKIYLQTPDYYIVADSSAIYTSGNINVFAEEEKEYISTALDIYFSQDDINVPYELYWSAGENFALCIEELDKILASLISIESPTTQDYASVLAAFIEKYIQAQENGTTVDELNDIAIAESLWKIIKFVNSAKSVPEDLKTIVTGIQSICATGVKTPEQLKRLFTLTYDLITNNAFVTWAQSSNELATLLSKISKVGITVQTLASKLEAIISNSKFWSKALGILNVAWAAKDALEHIVVFSITTFGNWQRHKECLSMMLTAIDSIPTENRTNNYKVLRGAVVELLDKYDEEFWDRLNNNLKTLASNTIVWGTKLLVAYACPGAMALLATAQFFVGLSNVREEADVIRMRQFYLIMDQAIFDEFKALYDVGDTFSTIYFTADNLVKMFLNMAIYTNDLAQNVNEYTDADKAVYKKNIEKIKTKFAIYLD